VEFQAHVRILHDWHRLIKSSYSMEGIAARENALVAEKNAQPVDEGERAE